LAGCRGLSHKPKVRAGFPLVAKKDDTAEKRTFTIREMEIGDLDEVYRLGQANFKADLWPMLYRGWDEYEVTTLFNTDGEYCLVAENDEENPPKDERIVGFILGMVMNKSGSAWSYGYVVWLCSHENWGREGVASKLVDKLIEIMVENEGIRIIMADTDPTNERAVKFFTKKGLVDQKPHLYMSSNLEQNPHYRDLVLEYRRENSTEAEAAKRKLTKLLHERKRIELLHNKKRKEKRKLSSNTGTEGQPQRKKAKSKSKKKSARKNKKKAKRSE
jgi:ribosomal protein S18 acetylase RimI-like enzyme